MTLEVIGLGVGRTGTFSLKVALQSLGLGPCHHMHAVIPDKHHHVPYWAVAVAGGPNSPAPSKASRASGGPLNPYPVAEK